MTPQEMIEAGCKIAQRWPDAVISANLVGNLKIDDDTETGAYKYVGWVDCKRGEVTDFNTGEVL